MKTTRTPAMGAYANLDFTRQQEELARLKLQATIAIELEKQAWREAGLKPGMAVLDLGCGPGFTSCELARFVGTEGTVTGVDVNPGLLEIAHQAQATENVPNVQFQSANIYDLPLPPASFDFVYARFVFQHLSDPQRALEQVQQVLKPGGIVCILDIDDNWTSFAPASRSFVRFIRQSGRAQRRTHGNRMIGSCLYGLLRQNAFQNVHTKIVPLTTSEIGVQAFLGLAVMFRLALLGRLQRLLAIPQLRKIKAASQTPEAWGAVGVFVASGSKPNPS